jgi:hypothetical protein
MPRVVTCKPRVAQFRDSLLRLPCERPARCRNRRSAPEAASPIADIPIVRPVIDRRVSADAPLPRYACSLPPWRIDTSRPGSGLLVQRILSRAHSQTVACRPGATQRGSGSHGIRLYSSTAVRFRASHRTGSSLKRRASKLFALWSDVRYCRKRHSRKCPG